MTLSTQHVILIGAARSGTKILRDSLALATAAGAVPYDVGFVWRVGAPSAEHDVLDPASLTQRDRKFIIEYIDRYARGEPPAVIEKTVGNTLRVPFVAAALPRATFVHLIRNGIDVAESAMRQWRNPPEYRYLATKFKHFPLRLVPTYGFRYAQSLMHRRTGGEGRVETWGPRYPGIDADLFTTDLLTVCARQWRESVNRASRDFASSGLRVIEVRYEDLVVEPQGQLARIADFCGLAIKASDLNKASARIVPGRAGGAGVALDQSQLALLDREIGQPLTELGYTRPTMLLMPDEEEPSHDD